MPTQAISCTKKLVITDQHPVLLWTSNHMVLRMQQCSVEVDEASWKSARYSSIIVSSLLVETVGR